MRGKVHSNIMEHKIPAVSLRPAAIGDYSSQDKHLVTKVIFVFRKMHCTVPEHVLYDAVDLISIMQYFGDA